VGIKVITLFEIQIGGPLQTRSLDKFYLTALSIWLVEAIHSPDVKPLSFSKDPFIYRVTPEKGDPYLKVSGCDMGMNMLEARELLDDIDSLSGCELLLEDTYPKWYDHPKEHVSGDEGRYKVETFKGELLTYVDTRVAKPILPIALKFNKSTECYNFIIGSKESLSSPYYKFD
jgi:hypothetical protein